MFWIFLGLIYISKMLLSFIVAISSITMVISAQFAPGVPPRHQAQPGSNYMKQQTPGHFQQAQFHPQQHQQWQAHHPQQQQQWHTQQQWQQQYQQLKQAQQAQWSVPGGPVRRAPSPGAESGSRAGGSLGMADAGLPNSAQREKWLGGASHHQRETPYGVHGQHVTHQQQPVLNHQEQQPQMSELSMNARTSAASHDQQPTVHPNRPNQPVVADEQSNPREETRPRTEKGHEPKDIKLEAVESAAATAPFASELDGGSGDGPTPRIQKSNSTDADGQPVEVFPSMFGHLCDGGDETKCMYTERPTEMDGNVAEQTGSPAFAVDDGPTFGAVWRFFYRLPELTATVYASVEGATEAARQYSMAIAPDQVLEYLQAAIRTDRLASPLPGPREHATRGESLLAENSGRGLLTSWVPPMEELVYYVPDVLAPYVAAGGGVVMRQQHSHRAEVDAARGGEVKEAVVLVDEGGYAGGWPSRQWTYGPVTALVLGVLAVGPVLLCMCCICGMAAGGKKSKVESHRYPEPPHQKVDTYAVTGHITSMPYSHGSFRRTAVRNQEPRVPGVAGRVRDPVRSATRSSSWFNGRPSPTPPPPYSSTSSLKISV